MQDLSHVAGGDLSLNADGTLALADGAQFAGQQLVRRLVTRAGDYIFHLDYGAGLPQYVGRPVAASVLDSLIVAQADAEESIVGTPTVTLARDGNTTTVVIGYTADGGESATLELPT